MSSGSTILDALYRGDRGAARALALEGELTAFEAAALGDGERLRTALDAGPRLAGAWTADGFTALHLASYFGGSRAAVELLLERGADPRAPARNATRVTPLHSAVAGGQVDIVAALLEHGAAVDARQQQGFTALHGAAFTGNRPMMELLLAHGADPDLRDDHGRTAADLLAGQTSEVSTPTG
jgi:uncharacterized protein